MDRNSCFIVRKNVAIEDFQDGSLALLCDSLQLISLNKTAKEILEWLDSRRPISVAAEMLARKYGCPDERVLKDIQELLVELEERGIVELCTDGNKGVKQ